MLFPFIIFSGIIIFFSTLTFPSAHKHFVVSSIKKVKVHRPCEPFQLLPHFSASLYTNLFQYRFDPHRSTETMLMNATEDLQLSKHRVQFSVSFYSTGHQHLTQLLAPFFQKCLLHFTSHSMGHYTLVFFSDVSSSSQYMYNCLLNISTLMSNRYLNLTFSEEN